MIIFVLECVSEGFRGEMTRWLLELHAGIYVGNISAAVRDRLWNKAVQETDNKGGSALMVFSQDTEQGFDIRMVGEPSRRIVDFEGIKLVSAIQAEESTL